MEDFNYLVNKIQERKNYLMSDLSIKKKEILDDITHKASEIKSQIIDDAQERAKIIIENSITEVENFKSEYVRERIDKNIDITKVSKEKLDEVVQFIVKEVLEDF